jgi:hypothetical protein
LKEVGTNSLAVARIIPNGFVSTYGGGGAETAVDFSGGLLPVKNPGGATEVVPKLGFWNRGVEAFTIGAVAAFCWPLRVLDKFWCGPPALVVFCKIAVGGFWRWWILD